MDRRKVAEATATRSANILVTAAERLIYSATNYWLVLASDVVGALIFLVVGILRFSGSIVVAAVSVIVAFIAWGFVEYAFHRWLLHGRPSIARRGHARHHAHDTALIGLPVLVAVTVACTIWAILSLVFAAGVASLLVFGFYARYNYYGLLHHLLHHRGKDLASVPCLARLGRAHRIHHDRHVVNYGVSTTIWDRLLGTFQPSGEPGADQPSRRRRRRIRVVPSSGLASLF
jgi:sterol desaturase/sphingolipid hydroxylase (fatty acid hydroxylase superfamily)